MNDRILEKAKEYRKQGHGHQKIRQYLNGLGYAGKEISYALKRMDDDEIDELYTKQKLNEARNQLLAALLVFAMSIFYTFYRMISDHGLEIIVIYIPTGVLGATYFRFRRIKNQRYTASKILKENRRSNRI